MHLQPQNDWVVVKMVPIEEKVSNGVIILADTTAQRIRQGTVVTTGPGRRVKQTGERIPVGVKEGEKVAFFRWNQEHKQGQAIARFLGVVGDDIGLIREADILFAFEGELNAG